MDNVKQGTSLWKGALWHDAEKNDNVVPGWATPTLSPYVGAPRGTGPLEVHAVLPATATFTQTRKVHSFPRGTRAGSHSRTGRSEHHRSFACEGQNLATTQRPSPGGEVSSVWLALAMEHGTTGRRHQPQLQRHARISQALC